MKKSHITAIGMVIVTAAWIASGQFTGTSAADKPEAATGDPAIAKPKELVTVRAHVSEAKPRAGAITLRGRTEALRTVALRSETEGRVVELPVEKGSRVAAGAVVCRLATEDRAAGLAEANATLKQRELEHAAAVQLSAKGFTSQTRAAESAAQLDSARAMVARMKIALDRAEIRAPFDAIVESRPAEIGDLLMKGGECATLVDANPMLVVGQVAEREVGMIEVGRPGNARLIDGTMVEGKVRFIGKTAQATTRTFRVELEVPNPEGALKSGLSAEIMLPTQAIPAHLVSPAILGLDDAGIVGVRTVDEAGIVSFVPAIPVASTSEGMWIAGLPPRATLIVVGQDYVQAGQKVNVVLDGPQS